MQTLDGDGATGPPSLNGEAMNDFYLKRAMMAHVKATLAAHNGNKKATAKALGIGRTTLYRYMRKLAKETLK
jgi:transcriptional regulator of acetoin/glycerol metabolism